MSGYIDLKRIEFAVTDACSGQCRHCSAGVRSSGGGGADTGASVDADAAVRAVKRLARRFDVASVMTFGGEPLLFADTVCKIHRAAADCGVPKRQLITNGYFSGDIRKIDGVARALCKSGVNDVLLSVDAFHQEYIPLEPVELFAEAMTAYGVHSLRVHPAWVVDKGHDNRYNAETRRLVEIFAGNGIAASGGNVVFASGNALINLPEYFAKPDALDLAVPCGSAPYTSRLDEVDCICIDSAGDVNICVPIGNIFRDDILNIIECYNPYGDPVLRSLLDGGAAGLQRYANERGVAADISDCRTACGACRKIMAALKAMR